MAKQARSSREHPTIDEALRKAVETAVERGWSINALAKAAGVPQPSLHRYTYNDRGLAPEFKQALADFFDMRLTRPRRNLRPPD